MSDLMSIQFLNDKGIQLNTTCLNTVIDGFMRQPDLCGLLDEFAKIKVKEFQDKNGVQNQRNTDNSQKIV